ncbi:MAG: PDZ domain-containing protein, partial [Planctomycetota bacterium]|nr:PDZ domain-containing protein [Planctomycetota bacterium]
MERRLVLFGLSAALIVVGWGQLQKQFLPPLPPAEQPLAGELGDEKPDEAASETDDKKQSEPVAGKQLAGAATAPEPEDSRTADDPDAPETPESAEQPTEPVAGSQNAVPVVLGSAEPGNRVLVVLDSRGGAIERIELTERLASGEFRYQSLVDHSGYLGPLGLEIDESGEGLRVRIVGSGTPAAEAGLQSGDLITGVDGQGFGDAQEFQEWLASTKPGQSAEFSVNRS